MFRRNKTLNTPKTLQAQADAKAQGMYKGNYFSFPDDNNEEFVFIIQTKEYAHKHFKKKTSLTNAHFILPIPQQLTDQQGINYNTVEMGAIGGAAAQVGMDVGSRLIQTTSAREAGRQVAAEIQGIATAAMKGFSEANPADALNIANVLAGGEGRVGGALGAFMGEVPNPNITAFFKGVPLKEHSFTWDLYPQSDDESFKLQLLINELRQQALPGREGKVIGAATEGTGQNPGANGGTTIYPFLTYPKEAHCTIVSSGKQSTIVFKPSFITAINANYAPAGPAFLENGSPAGIQLTLGFKEIDIWTREDYQDEVEFFGDSPATTRIRQAASSLGLDRDIGT